MSPSYIYVHSNNTVLFYIHRKEKVYITKVIKKKNSFIQKQKIKLLYKYLDLYTLEAIASLEDKGDLIESGFPRPASSKLE